MSSNESMDESLEYDYEDSTDEDLQNFIDDNNYTLNDSEDNDSEDNISVEIIDSESNNEESNQMNEVIPQNTNQTNQSDIVNEEVERLQSEHNYDSKPDIKTLNESVYCTQDNSDNSCIICTEIWTTSGVHQLVSLSCGHLFGRKCIEQWLDPKKAQNQRCPQCNKTAKKKDIRAIYARNLRSLDTTERDRALQLLEKERQLRKQIEAEAILTSIKLKEILKENERLKKEYMDCQQRVQQMSSNHKITENLLKTQSFQNLNKKVSFEFVREIEMNSSGDCRHLGYSGLFEIITVSQPNPNNQLFPGYGVKKIFLNDFKTDNICIHSKPIRDLEINAYDGTILTTSLDKTVKLTSLLNKSSIMSYNLEVDAWSVTFNPKNKHEFYVGLNNGRILLFDIRNMSSHIDHLNSSDSSPVVSLNQIEFQSSVGPINGILSTQFNNFCFYERNSLVSGSVSNSDFTAHKIPIEGRFSSAHFEPKQGLALLSCRPSSKHIKKTHYVCLSTYV